MKRRQSTAPWLAALLLPCCLLLSACLQSDISLMPQTMDQTPFAGTYILKTVHYNGDSQKFDIQESKTFRLTVADGRLKGESAADVPAAGKAPALIEKEIPGFIGNRLQFAMLREAWALWASGAAPWRVWK